MIHIRFASVWPLAVAVAVTTANAQDMRIRPIGPAVAMSEPVFGIVTHVIQLSDGSVFVNDPAKRRVTLLRPDLSLSRIVIDSIRGSAREYGPSDAALVPYLSDSTLFVGPSSAWVLGPDGRIVRMMPLPVNVMRQALMVPRLMGYPGVSPLMGLVFRVPIAPAPPRLSELTADQTYAVEDSAVVVALDLTHNRPDTLARLATGRGRAMRYAPPGPARPERTPPGLAVLGHGDEWALMTDGTVGVVRGHNYRIEWIAPGGARTFSPPLPHDWKRLSDSDKDRYADSLNRAQARVDSIVLARWIADSIDRARAGVPNPTRPPEPYPQVRAEDVPDFLPAIDGGGNRVRADMDNNLWIRPRADSVPGRGSAYDVINRAGVRIDRVELPANQMLMGFGRNGMVYLVERQASGMRLVAYRR